MKVYFVIINIISFILYCINMILNKFKYNRDTNILLIIISFFGGSIGIIFAILLFDRTISKNNIMFRIFIICMFIIELLIFIIFKNNCGEKINFAIWELFCKYKTSLVYLCLINIITFIVFTLDKINAILGHWRFKIVTLLSLCFIGGTIGGLLSMYMFKHKTNVNYFTWGIPIIITMHIVTMIFLINVI